MSNMAEDQTRPCGMDDARLALYADHELFCEAEEIEIEVHLAGCPDCAEYVQQLRSVSLSWATLSPEFPALVQRMALLKTGSSALLVAIMRGLEVATQRAERSHDNVKVSRLQKWGRRLATNAQQAVEKLSAVGTGLQSFQTASVEVLREVGWAWMQRIDPLAGASPSPVREAPSGFRARGFPAEAKGPAQGVEIRIEPVPASKDVEVIVKGIPAGLDRVIALLVPKDAPDEAQEEELRRMSEDDWIARFKNVAPGEYAMAIEPLSNRTVE